MTATPPERTQLIGDFVQLDPLTEDHLPRLFAAIGHEAVFAGGYGGGIPAPADEDEFRRWALGRLPWERGNPYAVILRGGPRDGELVGTTSLAEFDPVREHTHLGWTAYDPRVWGTAVNPEAKLLLLRLAFDHGFGRVKIQTDVRNARSRAAIAGIGASFEGIVRRDVPLADGSWRDSAVFSVIVDDWPVVRARLEARLDAFRGRPVLFRTPPDSSPPASGE